MYNVTIRFRPETKADEKRYYNVEEPAFSSDTGNVVIYTYQTPKKVAVFHWSDILELLYEEVE